MMERMNSEELQRLYRAMFTTAEAIQRLAPQFGGGGFSAPWQTYGGANGATGGEFTERLHEQVREKVATGLKERLVEELRARSAEAISERVRDLVHDRVAEAVGTQILNVGPQIGLVG